MPRFAMERVRLGKKMPGLILAPFDLPIGAALDSLLLPSGAGRPEDFRNHTRKLTTDQKVGGSNPPGCTPSTPIPSTG